MNTTDLYRRQWRRKKTFWNSFLHVNLELFSVVILIAFLLHFSFLSWRNKSTAFRTKYLVMHKCTERTVQINESRQRRIKSNSFVSYIEVQQSKRFNDSIGIYNIPQSTS